MDLSASIFQTLGLLKYAEVQQGIIFLMLPLLLPSLYYFMSELVIFHKLIRIFTINLVCSHFYMIPQLGKALEGGHCGHATIFLEEASNDLAKKLNFLFSFYSSIWHVFVVGGKGSEVTWSVL